MSKDTPNEANSAPGLPQQARESLNIDNAQIERQIRTVPSILESLTRANPSFKALAPNLSLAQKIADAGKTIDSLKLATSAFDSVMKASKTLDILGSYPSPPAAFGHVAPHPARMAQNAGKILQSPADFGQVLRETRKTMGLTQQQFADLAGVGRRFVSECESGKPRLEFGKVIQVAKAGGIDLFARRR